QSLMDPQKQGKYTDNVNGQAATRPQGGQRHGGAPVERFAEPLLVTETPESLAFTTPKTSAGFAGGHHHLVSQQSTHFAAGKTIAAAAGRNAGLYAAAGGLKAVANHGPVSIEAHTDAMAIRAAGDITVTSTETRIDVLAKRKIVLQAGASAITLDGQNLTIACPGKFDLKTAKHQFTGGDSQAAELPVLPSATVEGPPNWIAIQHRDADGQPFAGQNYKIFF